MTLLCLSFGVQNGFGGEAGTKETDDHSILTVSGETPRSLVLLASVVKNYRSASLLS